MSDRPLGPRAGFVACLALTVLAAPGVAEAGAWTKDFGAYYAKIGADFYRPEAFVDPETGEETSDSYFGQSYGVYLELGLFPLWPIQLSVHLPVSVGTVTFIDPKSFQESKAITTRFGDLRIGFQGAILRKTVQLSLGLQVKIPLYSNDGVGEGKDIYAQNFALPGDGQIDINPQIHLGGGIPETPLWMTGGVGYLHRTSTFIGWDTDLDFVDSLSFTYTFGGNAGPVLVLFQLDGNKNFVDDEVTREALALGPAVAVNVWRGLSISARLQGEVWAQNAPRGVSFGLGVSYQRPNNWTRAQEAETVP